MNKILLLGGDGFIGKSFKKHKSQFFDSYIVSRFSQEKDENEIVVEDINSLDPKIFEQSEIVFNCLGIAHRDDSANRDLFYRVNRDLTINLAKTAKARGVKKFVQMSSISVYGDSPFVDIKTPVNPTTHYGKSKAEADEGLLKLQDKDFSIVLLRPPMIYGQGAPGNMGKLIRLVKILPVLPFLDAQEPREFLFVGNFVKMVEFIIKSNLSEVVLMKDIKAFSTYELVSMIIDSANINKKIIRVPLLKESMKYFTPSIYKKLFSGLKITCNFTLPEEEKKSLFNPADAIREMAQTY